MYDDLTQRPAARCGAALTRSTNQTIPTGVNTAITFDTARYNPVGMWNVARPTQVFAPVAGYYMASGGVTWDTAVAGTNFATYLIINGVDAFAFGNHIRSAICQQSFPISGFAYLNPNDYVELWVLQDTGGNLDVIGTVPFNITFGVHRLP